MAIIDGLMLFTGTSNGASGGITLQAYTDAPTTGTQTASNIIDIGITSGAFPHLSQRSRRQRSRIGDDPSMKLVATCPIAWVGGTSVQVEFAGAPDNGSGGQGSYTVMWLGPVIAVANLVIGAQLCNVDIPRVVWEQVLPRFLRMRFISVGTLDLFGGGLDRPELAVPDRRHHWRSVRLSCRCYESPTKGTCTMKKLLLSSVLALGLYAPAFTITPAHAVGCGVNFTPTIGVNCANVRVATYSAAILKLVPAATPTDFFCISGSATKTIHVRRIELGAVGPA